jgi:hypothetical protein
MEPQKYGHCDVTGYTRGEGGDILTTLWIVGYVPLTKYPLFCIVNPSKIELLTYIQPIPK